MIDWSQVESAEQREARERAAKLEVFKAAIQGHLDAEAKAHGYDSIASAVTYADEPAVPKFQNEGIRFRAWRSLVWDYGYSQLALVDVGQRHEPSIDEFLQELPAFVALV